MSVGASTVSLGALLLVLLPLDPVVGTPALALQGGGIRALASDAGLVAGVARIKHLQHLRQLGQSSDVQADLNSWDLTAVLKQFHMVSSVSGSSWFAAELFFSSSFLDLLAGIASSPSKSAQKFEKGWIGPWLRATGVTEPEFDSWQTLVRLWVKFWLGTGDEDTIFLAQFFLATGLSWNHFVDVLLNSTAGISSDAKMGSLPAFPTHQVWLVDHTLLLPSGGACISEGKLLLPHVRYKAETGTDLPIYLPAAFSIKLGAGLHSVAPVSYMALPEVPIKFNFEGVWLGGSSSKSSSPMFVDATNGSLMNTSGQLPIARTVAASSAFFGSAIDSVLLSEISAQLSADVAVWVGETGFEAAEHIREELQSHVDSQAISQLAQIAFHALLDGGFTDGTGVAQAVAAGSSEVVAVLNSFSSNQPEYVAQLFPGGTVIKPGVPKELFPVFQSPNASTVQASFEHFETLQIAAGSMYLKVLAIGTIDAVTADNAFFGITRGRAIKIQVINICSELSIGLFANFAHYSNLVEEIVLTISDPANQDAVLTKLMPLFDSSFDSRPHMVRFV
ncbi:unnamed protein product [Durusdinium trenchii]|uniref:Integrase catalytic domain-containing protein n=3 Tax=Durusdinium trenchii TaxID=1381693 RepID=A0ABP0N144_9DINO